MPENDFYKPMTATCVPGETISLLRPNDVKHFPFRLNHKVHGVIVVNDQQTILPQSRNEEMHNAGDDNTHQAGRQNTLLRRVSPLHGRSYGLQWEGLEASLWKAIRNTGVEVDPWQGVLWEDEFGNLFSQLCIKGNNCAHPHLMRHNAAPEGIEVYGMQMSLTIGKIAQVSYFLRSLGVDTEIIINVTAPLKLPFKGEFLSQAEFQKKLLEIAVQGTSGEEVFAGCLTPKEVDTAKHLFKDSVFFTLLRGMQVSERVNDLREAVESDLSEENDCGQAFQTMIERVFAFVNLEKEYKRKRVDAAQDAPFEALRADNQADIIRYFLHYLPERTMKNLALMHGNGVIHGFLHSGNISAVGGLVDLDSVRGEPLGDEPITIGEMGGDVLTALNGLEADIIMILQKTCGGHVVDKIPLQMRTDFLKMYLKYLRHQNETTAYDVLENIFSKVPFACRGEFLELLGDPYRTDFEKYMQPINDEATDNVKIIIDAVQMENLVGHKKVTAEILDRYLGELSRALGWEYKPSEDEDIECLIKRFLLKCEFYIGCNREALAQYKDVETLVENIMKAVFNQKFLTDAFSNYLYYDVIEENIYTQFRSEMSAVERMYGQEVYNAIVFLFMAKYGEMKIEAFGWETLKQELARGIQEIVERVIRH